MNPPIAKQIPITTITHGHSRTDPYHWLREKENPEVISYLEAENTYADHSLAPLKDLQNTLYQEMRGRIQEADLEVPVKDGAYWYYSRTEEGKQYRVYCRKLESLEAAEEVLLDLNALAAEQQLSYLQLGVFSISPDQTLLAYSIDTDGGEEFAMYIKRLSDGTILETVASTYYSFAWANDNQHYFFVRADAAWRPYQVYRKALGNPLETMVFEEPDELFFVGVERSKSKQYLHIESAGKITAECLFLDADTPLGEWQVFAPKVRGVDYRITYLPNHGWLVETDENAINSKLVLVPEHNTTAQNAAREGWLEWLPHDPKRLITNIEVFDHYLVIRGRELGLTQLWVQSLETRQIVQVTMPDAVYTIYSHLNPMMDSPVYRYQYQSLAQPRQVVELNLFTLERVVLKEDPVLGGFNAADYITERLEAISHDGTAIPISLVYKRGALEHGTAPLYLYGYGSYGISSDPTFTATRLPLLDRGVVYAVAHIRGGQEMGRAWYEHGKWLEKKNTFLDFIACAEHLKNIGYTSTKQLAIRGGSAGGLLVGACMTMRPDLCQAVVALVPFVDALNTMLDSSLPLTVAEYEEWGNPNELEYYEYMASYSPYENTKSATYPHVFVTAGLNDPRVSYHEPAKWVAQLRQSSTSQNSIVLRTNMGAGHGGSSGRFDRLLELAEEYAFVLEKIGVV